jgi:L-iditol 2-dehydrogenase
MIMKDKMLAAVFEGEGALTLKEVPVPRLSQPDQLLLKVDAVSICGTDVHILSVPPGYVATPNTILGHELCGTVVEKGAQVKHLDIGDRVVVNPNDYCGVCTFCRKNLPNECENIVALGIHSNGAFAEYCLISGKVAYKISKDVPVGEAACAEPLACVINGTNKIRLQPGETAAVIGAGPIGMMTAILFKASWAGKVFIADQSPYRIEHARQLNIGRVVDVRKEDLREVILKETGIGVDVAADVVGTQLATCINISRKGGRLMVFGVNSQSVAQFPQSLITFKELQVLGTWLANATFPEAVRILESCTIDMSSLITETIPLSDIHKGIAKLAKGDAVKIIVTPQEK